MVRRPQECFDISKHILTIYKWHFEVRESSRAAYYTKEWVDPFVEAFPTTGG